MAKQWCVQLSSRRQILPRLQTPGNAFHFHSSDLSWLLWLPRCLKFCSDKFYVFFHLSWLHSRRLPRFCSRRSDQFDPESKTGLVESWLSRFSPPCPSPSWSSSRIWSRQRLQQGDHKDVSRFITLPNTVRCSSQWDVWEVWDWELLTHCWSQQLRLSLWTLVCTTLAQLRSTSPSCPGILAKF